MDQALAIADALAIQEKMKVAARLDIRQEFAHGVPDRLRSVIAQNLGLNNASPRYRPQSLNKEGIAAQGRPGLVNEVFLGNKLANELNLQSARQP